MSKTKKNNELNLVKSVNKNVRSSTRKLKPILKALVGKKVDFALRDLEFSNKRICGDVKKTLASAIANAENNHQLDIDKLVIEEASTGKAMVMKRFRPRARGRSGKILKPFSNIRIVVKEKEEVLKDTNQKDQKSDQQNTIKEKA